MQENNAKRSIAHQTKFHRMSKKGVPFMVYLLRIIPVSIYNICHIYKSSSLDRTKVIQLVLNYNLESENHQHE